jgi:hypothetical protein
MKTRDSKKVWSMLWCAAVDHPLLVLRAMRAASRSRGEVKLLVGMSTDLFACAHPALARAGILENPLESDTDPRLKIAASAFSRMMEACHDGTWQDSNSVPWYFWNENARWSWARPAWAKDEIVDVKLLRAAAGIR